MRLISICFALMTALALALSGPALAVAAVADHADLHSQEHVHMETGSGHHHHGPAPAHSHVLGEVLGGLTGSPVLPRLFLARSTRLGMSDGPPDWADCCYQLRRPPRV